VHKREKRLVTNGRRQIARCHSVGPSKGTNVCDKRRSETGGPIGGGKTNAKGNVGKKEWHGEMITQGGRLKG